MSDSNTVNPNLASESDICKKCLSIVSQENSICCDICNTWFHLKCSNISLQSFKTMLTSVSITWFCKFCIADNLPYSNINDNDLNRLTINTKIQKIQLQLINNENFSPNCTICNKNVTNKNKSIPCIICKSLIHKKCSNTTKNTFVNSTTITTWCCSTCTKNNLPFMELNNFEFNKLHKISNNATECTNMATKLKMKFQLETLNSDMKTSNINCDYYDMDSFQDLCNKQISKNNFSIFHSNISSLQGNFDKLELLLSQLNFKFDIISVTETWDPKHSHHTFEPNILLGYQQYIGQTGQTMKSGCGFFISDDISFIPRKDLDKQFYNQYSEFECKWIEIINLNKPNSIIASIYRHPRKNDGPFLDYLKTTLNSLKKENKLIFLSGDFNYNLLNHEKNKEVNEFLDILFSSFCQPYILHPTRIVDNAKPSLIDNIFANSIDHSPISGNLTCKISDHLPNFMILQNFDKNIKKTKIRKRNYKHFNEQLFLTELNNTDITAQIEEANNTNIKYDILHEHLLNVIDHNAPIKTLSKKETKNLAKPWISQGILTSIKCKNKSYKKFIKSKDPFWYNKYKTYRNSINHLIRASKNMYYKNYFNTFRNNSKKVWSGIKSIISNKKSPHTSINLQINGEIITNQKTVTNKFNTFFTNVGPNLSKQIPQTNKLFTDYLQQQTPGSMYLTPITSARNNGRSAFSDRQESVLERQDTIFTDHVDRPENSFRYPSVVSTTPYLK